MVTTTTTTTPSFAEIATAMRKVVELDDSTGSSPNELRKKFNATVEFRVDDEAPLVLNITENDGKTNLIVVTTSLSVLHDLLFQKLSPPQAFMQKKLKIKGKLALAMKLSLLLKATQQEMGIVSERRSGSKGGGSGGRPKHRSRL